MVRSAKIVLAAYGTAGDVLPNVFLARELLRRGHRVVIASEESYREVVENAGAEFAPIRPSFPTGDAAPTFWASAMNAHNGTMFLYAFVLSRLQEMYDDLHAATRDSDLLVSHAFFPAAPILAEATKIPWISCVLSPIIFNSRFDPPTPSLVPEGAHRPITGKPYARFYMREVRRRLLPVLEPIFVMRRALNLPTDKHPIFEGQHSPLRVLAMFSPLLAQPQPDWPGQTRITGFCVDVEERVLEPRLQQFLDEGETPVVFTLGASSVNDARDFWHHSAQVAKNLGCRALWTVGKDSSVVPNNLPGNIGVFEHVPLAQMLPRSRAIVHHGGSGTIALALRAGIPMLMVPQCHDQPTNAAHAARLGSGHIIWRHKYNAKRATLELHRLLSSPACEQRAKTIQAQIAAEDGVKNAADEIESVLQNTSAQ